MRSVDKELDVTGMNCPLPLIHIRKAVSGLVNGQVLKVTGDDPTFEPSVRDFCDENAFELADIVRDGRSVSVWLRARLKGK